MPRIFHACGSAALTGGMLRDPDGRRRMSGGKHSTCGTPQGGLITPPTMVQNFRLI
jgi:hypothetical protein